MDRRDFLSYIGIGAIHPHAVQLGSGGQRGFRQDFEQADWSGWAKDGVANLRVIDGDGVLEAATNIYPSDRQAAVFRMDARADNAAITATITEHGIGPGVVLRRSGPGTYYAAVLDREAAALQIIARVDGTERTLSRCPVGVLASDRIRLTLRVLGTTPTEVQASLNPADSPGMISDTVFDATEALQQPGDPGVLGTAETGFRAGPDWRTPLGTESARALWVTDNFEERDEGGIRNSPVPVEEAHRTVTELASSTVFDEIEYEASDGSVAATRPATVAATSLRPTTDTTPPGALVGVISDVPCTVAIEVASEPSFERTRTVDAGPVNRYNTAFSRIPAPSPGERFYWRPRLSRGDRESIGPVRSVRAFPSSGSPEEVSLAIGSCATQFGETFESIAEFDPDAFVWHGDLNYLDASGPLAQTESGYAGMWKDLLSVNELRPILNQSYFATQRDDHDYGKNDTYGDQIPEYTIDPYEGIVNPDIYYRFGGGLVDIWVTETRRWRDPVSKPDTGEKTLLGDAQREWLLDGLRTSTAPFNVVCSPGPLFNVPNDSTSWANAYTAERNMVLDVVAEAVEGRTVFVTGDTHSGCVTQFEDDDMRFLEVRAAPLDIPRLGQHDASTGDTVEYSEQGKFFCTITVQGVKNEAVMEIELRHSDGTAAWRDTLRVAR